MKAVILLFLFLLPYGSTLAGNFDFELGAQLGAWRGHGGFRSRVHPHLGAIAFLSYEITPEWKTGLTTVAGYTTKTKVNLRTDSFQLEGDSNFRRVSFGPSLRYFFYKPWYFHLSYLVVANETQTGTPTVYDQGNNIEARIFLRGTGAHAALGFEFHEHYFARLDYFYEHYSRAKIIQTDQGISSFLGSRRIDSELSIHGLMVSIGFTGLFKH